jgi:hypothetical protein
MSNPWFGGGKSDMISVSSLPAWPRKATRSSWKAIETLREPSRTMSGRSESSSPETSRSGKRAGLMRSIVPR